jgi:hypothetical protein
MNAIRHVASSGTAARRVVGLLLAVSAIVFGILAMHTLNLMSDSPSALSSNTATVVHHAETMPSDVGSQSCTNDCGPIDHEMASMSLCVLALLAGVLFVAAGIASWRQEQRWGPVLSRLFDALRAATPAPPSLHVLSISRT